VRRATSLVPLATLPDLLTRASLLFVNLAGSANPCELTFLPRSLLSFPAGSPSHLARASCNLAGSTNPCEFTFRQPCRVRRATSLVPLATLPDLLTRASLLFVNLAGSANPCELTFLPRSLLSFPAGSPSHLARASCNLAGSTNPCEFTFRQPCRVRRATSLVPLATLPDLLTRASLLFVNLAGSANPCELTFLPRSLLSFPAGSPSHLARASCNLAGSTNPCEFTFRQPCRVRRATSLVPLATLPDLLTRASLLFVNLAGSANPCELTFLPRSLLSFPAGSPSHLARASCNLAGSTNPCEFTFRQPCRVRRATSLVPLATLPDLLTRASLLFVNLAGSANPCELTFLPRSLLSFPAGSPSHLARASCNLAGSTNPCEFTFRQPCRVRRATSLVPLATLPDLLTRASLLFVNLAGSANPCELTFQNRKFAESPRSFLLQPCRVI
ncbi:hypothetical protein CRG98_046020, partial [Punica granatum]